MRAWSKLSNYRRRYQKWYLINCCHNCYVYKTNIRSFINSYNSHCHAGVISWSIDLSVDIFFSAHTCIERQYVLCIPKAHLVSKNLTLRQSGRGIELFCRAPLGCCCKAKTASKMFLLCVWFGFQSMNLSEWKVELNFDNITGRNCCFDAMCLIMLHYLTLGKKGRFFRVNDTCTTRKSIFYWFF